MQPKDFFQKKIIGKIKTRHVKKENFEIKEEEHDVIDLILPKEEGLVYVTNTWFDKSCNTALCIHKDFVKSFTKRI